MQKPSLRIQSYRSFRVDDTIPKEAFERLHRLETYQALCREGCCEAVALRTVGFSRVAYYRWQARYRACGVKGLAARSRRPQQTNLPRWSRAQERAAWSAAINLGACRLKTVTDQNAGSPIKPSLVSVSVRGGAVGNGRPLTLNTVFRHFTTMKYLVTCVALAMLLSACMSGGSAFQPQGVEFTEQLTAFNGTTWGLRTPPSDDGTEYTINSATDAIAQHEFVSSIPGNTGQTWLMMKRESDKTQLAYAIVSWNEDDHTDYLSGGWWMLYPGHPDQFDLFESEEGIFFIDGPELNIDHPPAMPVQGIATYAGRTSGIYQYVHGSGEYSLTEFVSQVQFTADFTRSTIEGCVGCGGEIGVRNFHYAALTENVDAIRADPAGYRMYFGPLPYHPDGTFNGYDVSVEHTVLDVTRAEGFFSGQFSNIPNDQGNPRLVTGIYSTDFSESDGGRGRFLGLWNTFGN